MPVVVARDDQHIVVPSWPDRDSPITGFAVSEPMRWLTLTEPAVCCFFEGLTSSCDMAFRFLSDMAIEKL